MDTEVLSEYHAIIEQIRASKQELFTYVNSLRTVGMADLAGYLCNICYDLKKCEDRLEANTTKDLNQLVKQTQDETRAVLQAALAPHRGRGGRRDKR